jgi:hypothetical protein
MHTRKYLHTCIFVRMHALFPAGRGARAAYAGVVRRDSKRRMLALRISSFLSKTAT